LPLEIDARMLMRRSKDRFRTMFADSVTAGLDAYLMELEVSAVSLCHELSAGPRTLLHCD
jgi:hypothetical protein